MNTPKHQRAVIFDVGGVLVDYDRDGTLATIAAKCGVEISGDDIAALIASLDLSEGTRTISDLFDLLVSQHGFRGNLDDLHQIWSAGLAARPWVPELLTALAEKATLYILSDTNAVHWQRITNGLLPCHSFSEIFLSHEFHLTKHRLEAFRYVLARIPYAPGEILFIDDTFEHVERARQVGLIGHHFRDQNVMRTALSEHVV
ncbi:MAG: hypothetical protein GKR90_01565 [Pseudomonadales bacterium]|nr:hypothetical protein [Pseudomonadales bacterium]